MMAEGLIKAVILARGLGTRMRRLDGEARQLDPLQARMADTGLKAMIPVDRPFLDYVLSGLADAGYREVCLVIGPEHDVVREYYTRVCVPKRLQVSFAIQERPLGTADALAAAEAFTMGERFLMLNSDNYYPIDACRELRVLGQPAIAAFERQTLAQDGNVSADRIRQFAVVTTNPDGTLQRIVEKPDESTLQMLGSGIYVSMNCWCFGPRIFRACASIEPSPRGELELTDAVQFSISKLNERFRVLTFRAAVLDLSSRSDIGVVADRLRGIEVNL
ncbi:MAG: nucleotidyltransferase family protein [Acidobacteriia bacterium]|nr:nucleotidyltransferase family protein [Terriglobia bacterium]